MASSAILNIDEPIQVDDSIQRYEVHGYSPESGTKINSTGEIRINITTKDIITHPYDSGLEAFSYCIWSL